MTREAIIEDGAKGPTTFTSKFWGRGRTVGFVVPDTGIKGVREVAEWVKSHEGHSVPYLTAEGLLIRFATGESHWACVGELVAYDTDGVTLILHGGIYGWEPSDE